MDDINVAVDIDEKINYNYNPFVPVGRLNRLGYFFYNIIFNIMFTVTGTIMDKNEDPATLFIALIFFILFFISGIFIVRNRVFDITLSNKKAWWFACIFTVVYIVLEIINVYLLYLTIPFALWLLFVPSKKSNTETNKDKNIVVTLNVK